MAGYRPPITPAMPGGVYVPTGLGAVQPVIEGQPQRSLIQPPHAQGQAVPAGAGLELAAAPQLVALLKSSLYPSQREWAADCLSHQDCHSQPQVVPALVSGAKDDPAPAVRAGCVRALARLHVNSPQVLAVLQSLQSDPDPRVRQEALEALPTLGAAAPARPESGLRAAGGLTGSK
jgi:HEAT repeat protein